MIFKKSKIEIHPYFLMILKKIIRDSSIHPHDIQKKSKIEFHAYMYSQIKIE